MGGRGSASATVSGGKALRGGESKTKSTSTDKKVKTTDKMFTALGTKKSK